MTRNHGGQRQHPQQVSPQDPTACQTIMVRSIPPSHPHTSTPNGTAGAVNGDETFSERRQAPHNTWELLRKEVIQPHLPVRLPCYDFVLIASPTFDNSLPYGLGRR